LQNFSLTARNTFINSRIKIILIAERERRVKRAALALSLRFNNWASKIGVALALKHK
jgi:hypothetical protein